MNLFFESLIILAILSLNFGIIIWFKNRIVMVSSVMIINLIIILLSIISISDYQILKELIIAIVIYSITILALIVNNNNASQINDTKPRIKFLSSKKLACIIILAISCGVFYLIHDIKLESSYKAEVQEKEIIKELSDAEAEVPADTTLIHLEPEHTESNILFKRSTDTILIIVGIMTSMLLGSKCRNRESNI